MQMHDGYDNKEKYIQAKGDHLKKIPFLLMLENRKIHGWIEIRNSRSRIVVFFKKLFLSKKLEKRK